MQTFRRALPLAALFAFLLGLFLGWLRPRPFVHQPVADFTRRVEGPWGTQPTGTPWTGSREWLN